MNIQIGAFCSDLTNHISVETGEIGYDDLDIYIMHMGRKQQFDLRNNGNGNYDVRFFPQEIGVFNVQVYCGGEQLPGN